MSPASPLRAFASPRLLTEVPGPRARAAVARDEAVTSPSLPRAYPLVPLDAYGSLIRDVDDNVFLDFNAGIATCSTGHCHPDVVAAIVEQSQRLLHYCSSDFYHPVYAIVCEQLRDVSPLGGDARVFLGNSGAEAVEAAIKLARHHTGRSKILTFHGSFHGRTYGAMSATTSSHSYRDGFGPLVPDFVHAPYNDMITTSSASYLVPDYVAEVVFRRIAGPREFAAIMVEPILGEGGYVPADARWLARLRELCDEHGILLIFDEVQSGCGRTGRFWASESYGIVPDILLAGKGLASGMPLSAVIARAYVMDWPAGVHGSTFGGNPVACAAAKVTIDLLKGGLVADAERLGRVALETLTAYAFGQPAVQDIRGRGLMIGVEYGSREIADAVEQDCFRRGLLVLRAGDRTVRVAPALTITDEQLVHGLELLAASTTAVGSQL